MKRFIREFIYDLKEPGICIWMIPILVIAFIFLSYFWHSELGLNDTLTLALLELLLPFMGGYASIMLMQGLLDTDGCEILFSYPRSNLYWGLLREIRFFCFFFPLVALASFLTANTMEAPSFGLFFLTLIQCFAVMGIAFGGIALTRRVSAGLIILIAFVGIQITLGREFSVFNLIYVLNGRYPSSSQIVRIGIRGLLVGIFGYGIGQVWIRPVS